jgi:hypothetical protein
MLLDASAEDLLNVFCRVAPGANADLDASLLHFAPRLGLSAAELACGLGFNTRLPELPDILGLLGIASVEPLLTARDRWLCQDAYRELSLESVLAVHAHAAACPALVPTLQTLLDRRLPALETCIERTVHAPTIERYRNELRALYRLGLMSLERFEARMERRQDGFRALVNEVLLAAETRLVPVGVLLYREDVLPREKQQLIRRGLVPPGLVRERLDCVDIPPAERELLVGELRLMQPA